MIVPGSWETNSFTGFFFGLLDLILRKFRFWQWHRRHAEINTAKIGVPAKFVSSVQTARLPERLSMFKG